MDKEAPKTVRELYFWLEGRFKSIDDLKRDLDNISKRDTIQSKEIEGLKTKLNSCQNELTEHKNNHWKIVGIYIGLGSIIVAIISIVFNVLTK